MHILFQIAYSKANQKLLPIIAKFYHAKKMI